MTTPSVTKKRAAVGFIGLGTMGEPMALNLLEAVGSITVWNRTAANMSALIAAGATGVSDAAEVFANCDVIVLMLSNEVATDAVMARGTSDFSRRVVDRLIIAMGTMPPAYSAALSQEIRNAGGRYVEAPVSGSRKQAEAKQLVAMAAGDDDDIDTVAALLEAMCRRVFRCGSVPNALQMKLSVNVFLITLVTGLSEATHFAERQGLDLQLFFDILGAGPMASEVSRIKGTKLAERDFSRQAGISDVLKNARLIVDAATAAHTSSPLMDVCLALYEETERVGLGAEDMVAVIRAMEQRTVSLR